MTWRGPDPNDPRLWWAGLAVAVVLLVAVLVLRAGPVPAPRLGLHAVDPEGVAVLVDVGAPCSLARVQLACERWAAHGWPPCVASRDAGAVRVVVYDGDAAGASAPDVVGVAPGRCGDRDPTLEHELGHTLYDLAHVSRSGAVMCHDDGCVGLAFPVQGAAR